MFITQKTSEIRLSALLNFDFSDSLAHEALLELSRAPPLSLSCLHDLQLSDDYSGDNRKISNYCEIFIFIMLEKEKKLLGSFHDGTCPDFKRDRNLRIHSEKKWKLHWVNRIRTDTH